MPKRGRPPGVKKNWMWVTKQGPDQKEITLQQLKTVYGVAEKRCVAGSSGCRRNCKDNPNCFLHLGGERWLGEVTSHSVVDEVIKERCRDGDTPVGLANLGATCYANSLLQIWFHDMAFRKAVYRHGVVETKEEEAVKMLDEGPAAKRLCARSDDLQVEATANPPAVTMATDGIDQSTCGSNERVHPIAVEVADTSPFQEFRSDRIVDHLSYLFTRLQHSRHKWLPPTHLVDFLGLEYQEQQDVQEFRKLFLNMLEPILKQDMPTGAPRNFLSQQYTGAYSYITVCKGCKSSTQVDSSYQELELSIENKATLQECLHEFFKEELLTGDNQYFCSHCGCNRDATRRIQLRSTPPVLTLILLRFVFNMELMAKVKVPSYVAFPEVLDLSAFTGHHDDVYHLSSAIIHTGPTAYSGHYIAHIKVPKDGKWWRFDDQSVKLLEGRNAQIGQEREIDAFGEPSKRPKALKGYFTSSNAYLLVYMRASDAHSTLDPEGVTPPEHMQRRVQKENSVLQTEVEGMVRDSCILQEGEERQRKELRELYSSLPVKPGSKSFHWLSTAWIAKLFSGNEPGVISNKAFLCRHNRLLPDAASQLKRVNTSTASYLYKRFGLESVELTNEMMCLQCVTEQCSNVRGQLEMQQDQSLLVSLLKTPCTSASGFWVGKTSLQSWKKLLSAAVWGRQEEELNRGTAEEGTELKDGKEDACHKKENVVSLLTDSEGEACQQEVCQQEACQQEVCQQEACQQEVCQQEACQQEQKMNHLEMCHLEKSQKISKEGSMEVTGSNLENKEEEASRLSLASHKGLKAADESSSSVKEDTGSFNEDVLCVHGQLVANEGQRRLVSAEAWSLFQKYFPSAPAFEALSDPCQLCMSEASWEVEEATRLKEKAENERAVLPDLYSLKGRPHLSEVNTKFHVVPKKFVQQWIQFVRHGGVRSVPQLDMASLLCSHKGLLLDLRKEEAAVLASVVLLWEHEWDVLKASYNTSEEIRLWRSAVAEGEGEGEGEGEKGKNTALLSDPAVCWPCVETQRRQKAMMFDKALVYVHATEGDPRTVEESRPTHSGWKLRRRLPPGCSKVEVSSLQTLADLKLQLMHIYGTCPSDMQVFFNGQELTRSELALVELGIVPNSLLVVKMTSVEESRNRFIRETAANEKEGGFTGTNLIAGPLP